MHCFVGGLSSDISQRVRGSDDAVIYKFHYIRFCHINKLWECVNCAVKQLIVR